MSIYLKNGEEVSREEFYSSPYNEIFASVYNGNPLNLKKAIEEIKFKGCYAVEACRVLKFVLGISLGEASMKVQEHWYKAP